MRRGRRASACVSAAHIARGAQRVRRAAAYALIRCCHYRFVTPVFYAMPILILPLLRLFTPCHYVYHSGGLRFDTRQRDTDDALRAPASC